MRTADIGPEGALAVDRGSSLLWHQLQKLRTTGSVLYTTGHPDDEEAGVLTLLSRGMGVRTALLTLNRGEGGANAIGPELFDGLGLIRTEELRLAGRYYGLDDQYFTTAVDYGYSKTLDEAMRSWDREAVLGDMVRVIRTNRPLVVISRWHGSERDGHGHHQAAGVLTPEAVEAAADPTRFPRQISEEGLRPWRVARLYRGRLLADEPHDAELNPHLRSPWLGESYQSFGSYGLSLQRSQTAGRQRGGRGPATPARYELLSGDAPGPTAGSAPAGAGVLDGLEVSLSGIGPLMGEGHSPEMVSDLLAASESVEGALDRFDPTEPSEIIPDLRAAVARLDAVLAVSDALPETTFLLAIKRRQLADALATAAGIEITARATPRGAGPTTPMGPAVPGQELDVHVSIVSDHVDARLLDLQLESRAGWIPTTWGDRPAQPLDGGATATLGLRIPADAEPTRSWFYRPDIRFNQYLVRDSAEIHLGESRSRAEVVATVEIEGTRFDVGTPVRTVESDAPFGVLQRPLEVAPAISLGVSPGIALRPADGLFTVSVDATSNAPDPLDASVELDLPSGWTSEPSSHPVSFSGAGQSVSLSFVVRVLDVIGIPDVVGVPERVGPIEDDPLVIRATASTRGRRYRDGYELIEHRDLRPQRLYAAAELHFYGFDAELPEGLRVGYVMGVGDRVPAAIEQLGALVTLLDAADLSGGDLGAYDAIVIGTRAYAVRADLVASNARLLDYAQRGGNLVVLYQTPEYVPEQQAPFPASLPGNAEETSEEEAAVTVLAPDHPLLTTPNELEPGAFVGWVEQRGSKFFASWADEYTALIETHDTGQPPQRGVWLTAPVGEGHFTYVALALHRQLPYGVSGAYRILANLLALGH